MKSVMKKIKSYWLKKKKDTVPINCASLVALEI